VSFFFSVFRGSKVSLDPVDNTTNDDQLNNYVTEVVKHVDSVTV
jgi:hypothetical protein